MSKEITLTVVSFGAGQDTIYFLHRIATDKEFREKHIKGRLLVVGSDTGEEHPHTYRAIRYMQMICWKHDIDFNWITPNMGFHPKTWQSLKAQYRKNNTIGSAAFPQTCTDNLKVKVVDNFVEAWIKGKYGYTSKRKEAYHDYYRDFGAIRLILGFAAGEDTRTSKGNKFDAVWKQTVVRRYYPLIEDGTHRADCIAYNEANINIPIYPSNCMICFYQSEQELVWLYRFHPEVFEDWQEMEGNKFAKDIINGAEKSLGVYGKKTLKEKLTIALSKYGDWTDEQLNEYKYSHGHCIKSKY